mgnify:CR=1 FL=1
MNEILATYAMEIIKVIALMIFTIIGVSAAKLQAKYINTETKRKVAATTVAYIEQVYKDLHGDEKLARALAVAASILSQKGIKTTDEELKVLIEAAVKKMNDAYKEEAAVKKMNDAYYKEETAGSVDTSEESYSTDSSTKLTTG